MSTEAMEYWLIRNGFNPDDCSITPEYGRLPGRHMGETSQADCDRCSQWYVDDVILPTSRFEEENTN